MEKQRGHSGLYVSLLGQRRRAVISIGKEYASRFSLEESSKSFGVKCVALQSFSSVAMDVAVRLQQMALMYLPLRSHCKAKLSCEIFRLLQNRRMEYDRLSTKRDLFSSSEFLFTVIRSSKNIIKSFFLSKDVFSVRGVLCRIQGGIAHKMNIYCYQNDEIIEKKRGGVMQCQQKKEL